MPRIARITVPHYPHHIVQRGNNKQVIFFDNNDRQLYLKLLKKYSAECKCIVSAYCLMLNHIHMLLTPLLKNTLSKIMQKLSLSYTLYINKKYKRTGRLWECRFYSSIIQQESYFWVACRYIERNPVRARIVESPASYKWSSAGERQGGKDHGFIQPIWHGKKEKIDYMNFLNRSDDKNELSIIRHSAMRGMPLGSECFVQRITENAGVLISKRPRGRPCKAN